MKAKNFLNPVLKGLYADPDLYYENHMYYLYPTTDGFPNWSGSLFSVFTSTDGRCFQKAATVLDVASAQVPWAKGYAWAPCIVKKGITYYFYFCAKNQAGIPCIGAAAAASPTGPFQAMVEPMVTMAMMQECGIEMSQVIDPSIYMEGSKAFLLFGNGEPAIAELSEDMLQIKKETVRNIHGMTDFRESAIVIKRENTFHFTWSCDDTGSEDYHVNYGVSHSLYGPVTFVHTLLKKDAKKGILGTGHHSIIKLPEEEAYVIAYHRFATPAEAFQEENGFHREICMAPLQFGENGKMLPVDVC